MCYFQSHFGLILSDEHKQSVDLDGIVFQSHFGLILSKKNCPNCPLAKKAFNPILVWFYQLVIFLCFAI